MSDYRGLGYTTTQMMDAPKNAIFVWCNQNTMYPRQLARKLGRTDLEIVGPSRLREKLLGRRPSAVVVDHATQLNIEDYEAVLCVRTQEVSK